MPQLDPTWFASQFFWLLISFLILYTLLSRFVLPPLQGIIGLRQQTVESDITQAQSMKAEAEQARQEYERTMAAARDKAQQLLTQAQEASKAKAEQAGRDLDAQVAKKLADATRKISAKKQELMDALTPAATELASLIVERLTSQAPKEDRVAAIVGELSKRKG